MSKRILGRPKKVKCILCNKIVEKKQPRFMIPIERPKYMNIIVHRNCFEKTDENTLKSAVIRHIRGLL